MESNGETATAKRLRLGLLLAWIPLMLFVVPTAIGISNALAQIATQKQTGLGAVAGGFNEMVMTFGLVVIVGSQVAAIVMLLRTLSRSHPIRTTVAIFSICCSGLLLFMLGLFLWSAPLQQWR
jgi:Ca2+/H+ antiporter